MNIPEKIFREYDIRGVVGTDLTDDFVYCLGKSIGSMYEPGSALAVGYDARTSSPAYNELLSKGLAETGCNVVQIGMVPTPVLYYMLQQDGIAGGVMITGSHNPSDMNGFKICRGHFPLYGEDIQSIRKVMTGQVWRTAEIPGKIEKQEILESYLTGVLDTMITRDLRFKVAIDAGNGVGALTAVPLLERLGCEVVQLYCDPDGRFPNHHPDPVYEKNLLDLKKVVLEQQCDIGFGFDGDADRIGVVSKSGRILYGDVSIILLIKEVLQRKGSGTFISEVKASRNLYQTVGSLPGAKIIMYKAGHSLIKAKMREVNADLGSEVSGHIFFFDRFFGFDDGPYAAARILEAMQLTGVTPDALLDSLPETFITEETRMDCPDEKKFIVVGKILDECREKGLAFNDIDGVRIEFERGWALVRASNTQPALVYRAEARTRKELDCLVKMVLEMIERHAG